MIVDDFDAVDLCAGPGGWDLAAHALGVRPLGVEIDSAACSTREAAGLDTLQADISTLDPADFFGVDGLIASPPCPAFSAAGKREGIEHLPALLDAIARQQWTALRHLDPEIWLPLEVGRWAETLRPAWIACEQVPPALCLWRAYEPWLRSLGYSTWTGVLNAADFGVPQTRRRAILLASLDVTAHPPAPTHAENPVDSLFESLAPWVSMAEALGWGMTRRPSTTVVSRSSSGGVRPLDGGSGSRRTIAAARERGEWKEVVTRGKSERPGDTFSTDRPSRTITGKSDSWVLRGNNTVGGGPLAERPVDEPALTVGSRADLWRFVALNTGRDWKPGGSREDAQAIPVDRPAPTLDGGHGGAGRFRWIFDRPATTIAGDPRMFSPGGHIANDGRDNSKMVGRSEHAIPVTEDQVAVLQSFPVGYPWQGNKTKRFQQIGNAVPPLLALHLLAAITGKELPR